MGFTMNKSISILFAPFLLFFLSHTANSQQEYYLVHKPTGAKMHVCSGVDGTPVASRPNNESGTCVMFSQEPNGSYFYIRSIDADKFIRPDTRDNGSLISIQPTEWRGNWTQWSYEERRDGYGHLVNRATGKHIHLSAQRNARLTLQPSVWRGDFTRWAFVPVNNAAPLPTSEPTVASTAAPAPLPTAAPSLIPTPVPTLVPTAIPTVAPTPTAVPTAIPTSEPTAIPTSVPTAVPIPPLDDRQTLLDCGPLRGSITNNNRLNTEGKEYLLCLHNQTRSEVALNQFEGASGLLPAASNMIRLAWDDKLEQVAQDYADRCVFQHNGARGEQYNALNPTDINGQPFARAVSVGENLAASGSSNLTQASMAQAASGIRNWVEEGRSYSFGEFGVNDFCSARTCGHFTQVIWASSHKVGCAVNYCRAGTVFERFASTILVCNYAPAGNFLRRTPYASTPSAEDVCTTSPAAQSQCSNGLSESPNASNGL